MTSVPLYFSADHPAFAGHFPGTPVLPGVLLLDAAVQCVSGGDSEPGQCWQVAQAKFQSAAQPGEMLWLEHEALANGSVRFAIRTGERAVANGILTRFTASREPDAI